MTLVTVASRSLASVHPGPAVAGLRILFLMRTRSPLFRPLAVAATRLLVLGSCVPAVALVFTYSSCAMMAVSLIRSARSSSISSSNVLSSISGQQSVEINWCSVQKILLSRNNVAEFICGVRSLELYTVVTDQIEDVDSERWSMKPWS